MDSVREGDGAGIVGEVELHDDDVGLGVERADSGVGKKE